ncbi:hypothetical protein HGRIS_003271 [Hohenbuehelia grisea]|uniref:Uncharacterized protein n=1 Tax=Hohenbuehelia grisea TaxID=104357 RepID=A0ABR3JMY8_9AGAR
MHRRRRPLLGLPRREGHIRLCPYPYLLQQRSAPGHQGCGTIVGLTVLRIINKPAASYGLNKKGGESQIIAYDGGMGSDVTTNLHAGASSSVSRRPNSMSSHQNLHQNQGLQ